MKYGAIYHRYTQNFGDDIQAYAGIRHLPHLDYMIDREEIDSFDKITDDYVCAIMGAWWMWKKWNWPPSDNLIPIQVGMHFTIRNNKKGASPILDECFTGIGKEYMESYGPVGCRDQQSMDILSNRDINNYFSGCITLTLPKMPKVKSEKEYICLVDLKPPVIEKIRKNLEGTDIEIKVMTHDCDYRDGKETWDERQKKVEEYLTIYQNAKYVITRRLHVTLPCLALETPVVWVLGEPTYPLRVTPYKDWVHRANDEEIINGEWDEFMHDPKENPDDYKQYREGLIETCSEFITKCENSEPASLCKIKYSRDDRIKWQNDLMAETFKNWVNADKKNINKLKKKFNTLKNKAQGSGKTVVKLPKPKFLNKKNTTIDYNAGKFTDYFERILNDCELYITNDEVTFPEDLISFKEIQHETDDYKNQFIKAILDNWIKINRRVTNSYKNKNSLIKAGIADKNEKVIFVPPLSSVKKIFKK